MVRVGVEEEDGAVRPLGVDELPSYFDEPAPTPDRRAGAVAGVAAAIGWWRARSADRDDRPAATTGAALVALDAHVRPASPTVVVSRVVPVAPGDVPARARRWPGRVDLGRDRAAFGVAPSGGDLCLAVATVDITRRAPRRPLHLTLSARPWSALRTELEVRPRDGPVAGVEHYYALAHAVLDVAARVLARG